MRTLAFTWKFLWSRPMGTLLNMALLSIALGAMTFLLLVGHQLQQAFERDLAGVDVVVGAKGSPMQLIMSGVFHIDVPPGNIPLSGLEVVRTHPMVASVIPLSLGDAHEGFRIVGTSQAFIAHYRATLATGTLWTQPLEVVLGATVARKTGMQVGSTFVGSHGIGGGGDSHGEFPYRVVGVLQPSGSTLDRLIVTDTASVWKVHEVHADKDHHDDDADHAAEEASREVTMALVTYRSPLAAVTFPRFINGSTAMQAAAPALEVTRLLSMLGVGTDVLRAFAVVLLSTAALSVLLALMTAVRERRADLALMRMLGAAPARVAGLLLGEALWIGMISAVCGIALGQAVTQLLAHLLQLDHSLLIGGLVWPAELWTIPALALGVSIVAAIVPCVAAYRISVLQLLQTR